MKSSKKAGFGVEFEFGWFGGLFGLVWGGCWVSPGVLQAPVH